MAETNRSLKIARQLRSIRSAAVRNLVRGLLAEKGDNSLGEKTDNILRVAKGQDYKTVVDALSALQRAGEVTLSLPLPPLPPAVADITYSVTMPEKAFLAYADRLMNEYNDVIRQYVEFTHELDILCEASDDQRIVACLETVVDKFGYSIDLVTRLMSLRYRHTAIPKTDIAIETILSPLNDRKRSIFFVAIEDAFDASRSYLTTRRTFMNFARGDRLNRQVRHYITGFFSPFTDKDVEIYDRARAFAGYSVIDLAQYILSSAELYTQSGLEFPSDLVAAVPETVRLAHEAARFTTDHLPLEPFYDDKFGQRSEFLFRHSPALGNYSAALSFRASIERCMSGRYDGLFTAPIPSSPLIIDHEWSPTEGILALCGSTDRAQFRSGALPAGRLELTGTFAYIVTNSTEALDVSGEQLLAALDACENIPLILTAVELSAALPPKPNDPLYELLRTTIVFDADQSLTTDYAVRQATERMVLDDYDGDILAMLQSIYSAAPSVGEYYFGFWTDEFLTQLYGLYESVEAVWETRERMLTWYGDYTDSEVHKERARSLSLENKLLRLRNEIDANRLHVDGTRLRHWMQDEVATAIRSLITSGEIILRPVENVSEAQNEILLLSDPGLQLARIVAKVFHEFCSNRSFGLDSYIGRRIRHGTFFGTITAEVRTILGAFIAAEQERNPDIAAFVAQRLRSFESDVRRFAVDRIQIRSAEKPKGLIVPHLDTDAKISHLKLIYKDIENLLDSTTNVPQVMDVIHQHCWLLVGPDLVNIRQQLERYRTERLFFDSRDLPAAQEQALRDARVAIHRANAIVQERVAQIASWFAQPPETLPSATLEELFRIVVEEARTQVSGYEPEVEIVDEASIRIVGHRHQYVYDALYVIVKNAAIYGNRTGLLRIATKKSVELERVVVHVEISNRILNSDMMNVVLRRIDQAMSKPIDGAMVVEGESGIPKLRSLESEGKEIRNVAYWGSDATLTCSFDLFLATA
ncbi:hypothetical protein [Mesorhizobium sp. CAU 1741]|uniref:hypothetical protein n=1 Tax=Mesorhizobium sp. CAU 1741 TaxID=3140366 RepID=UPI00325AC156